MAEKIRLLSPEIIGRIAAGEVVERPAAAVKELVENSLDAGASAVTVEIRDGGISQLRVTDNGSGIAQSEIRMAFERHATSKISRAEDLSAIGTLGFRGEALASIAAVSRLTCTSRTREAESGIRVQNEGGTISEIEETACPPGTTFVVRDLFYNTPVRLKFLKKPAAEAGLVSDVMMRFILSRPDVSFRYISQGKTVYHSAGDGKLESAVFSIYGSEMAQCMRLVDGHMNGVVLKGYVGIGEAGRSARNHQSFFVNGRYFRSTLLSSAVEEACRERVMIGKYPACVLHLTMPYELVDVNVHPNKLEVRFQQEQAVADAVETLVHDALQDRDALERPVLWPLNPPERPAAPVRVETPAPAVEQRSVPVLSPQAETAVPAQPEAAAETAPRPEETQEAPRLQETQALSQAYAASLRPQLPAKEEKIEQLQTLLPPMRKPLHIIGVVFKTYILVEYEDHLLMIDQHAVHERLLFEKLTAAYDRHQAGQELLIPMMLRVTQLELQLLSENKQLLDNLGLTVEPMGEREVAVRSIPMILGEPQTAAFVRDVLDQLQSERGKVTLESRRSAILQQACKHAVKGGETLREEDIRELCTRMVEDRVTPTCPHGRPLVVALSHTELDRRFKRIQ